jgi:hypothetical protein
MEDTSDWRDRNEARSDAELSAADEQLARELAGRTRAG